MTRQVLYVAAPLRPTEADIEYEKTFGAAENYRQWTGNSVERQATDRNVQRALRWLAWLRKSFLETTFIAPWIASVLAGADDADPAQREAGFVDDCAVVERCDGIVLCGGRICSGMQREMEHWIRFCEGRLNPFGWYDLTAIGSEPPTGTAVEAKRWADEKTERWSAYVSIVCLIRMGGP